MVMIPGMCKTCGNPPDNHPYRHPYNDGSVSWSQTVQMAADGSQATTEPPQPMSGLLDPVLRQALVDKGVITPEDLRAAEDKIRAITQYTLGGS